MKRLSIFIILLVLVAGCSKSESNIPDFLKNTEKYSEVNLDKYTLNIPTQEKQDSFIRRYVFSIKNKNIAFDCNLSSPADPYRKVNCNGTINNKSYEINMFPGKQANMEESDTAVTGNANSVELVFPRLSNDSKIFIDKLDDEGSENAGDINLSLNCVNTDEKFGCINSENHGFSISNNNTEIF